MNGRTFYLRSMGVIDDSLSRKGQNKPKRAVMSAEQHRREHSVRSTLLGTLIEKRARLRETPPATTALKTFQAKVYCVHFVKYVDIK